MVAMRLSVSRSRCVVKNISRSSTGEKCFASEKDEALAFLVLADFLLKN
jgi:hypothetical protein